MTTAARRARNPIHEAADLVPAVKDILRRHYPDKLPKDIYDRACALAEWIARGKPDKGTGTRVHNYLNSAKSDRRRLR